MDEKEIAELMGWLNDLVQKLDEVEAGITSAISGVEYKLDNIEKVLRKFESNTRPR